ncbi:CBS domain-containing protein [Ensifer sp. NPDC090286]|uniref:CBS domain-containing protein n=1 Tax=Ensifer sp. NPDC090286 TaxID=3363991 RepID=UPI00383BF4FA
MHAADIMTRKVTFVSPDHGVRHAVTLMLDRGVSGLPVCDDSGNLVGMLSEGDLIQRSELGPAVLGGRYLQRDPETYIHRHSWRVGDVMSFPVVAVEADTSVDQIAALMEAHSIKRVPVVHQGRLVGIVSRRDILKVIVAEKPEKSVAGDEAMKRAVLTRLSCDLGMEQGAIEVKVEAGVVALTGFVESGVQRLAARVAAETVCGAGWVRNEWRVANGADCKTVDQAR